MFFRLGKLFLLFLEILSILKKKGQTIRFKVVIVKLIIKSSNWLLSWIELAKLILNTENSLLIYNIFFKVGLPLISNIVLRIESTA